MDTDIKYRDLYLLQDKILEIMSQCDTDFYLTGGTCLHRFISSHRYSDDLDFFTSDSSLYRDYARRFITAIRDKRLNYKIEVDTRDFIRLQIEDTLKVDCVNDRVFRYGQSEQTEKGYNIDNILNLLANKISAIIGRDEPKDLFDIITIYNTRKIDWDFILEIALKKSIFEKDYLVYRIQSFPTELFNYLSVIEQKEIEEYKKYIPDILKELISI